jgi:hypothetical protein
MDICHVFNRPPRTKVHGLRILASALSNWVESESALDSLFDRIFCGKPVPTFPENALARDLAGRGAADLQSRRASSNIIPAMLRSRCALLASGSSPTFQRNAASKFAIDVSRGPHRR